MDRMTVNDRAHSDDAPSPAGAVRVALFAAFGTLVLAIAVRNDPPDPVNVPILSADGRLFYILTVGIAVVTGVFAQRVEREREALAARRSRYVGESVVPALATAWILPALIVVGAVLLAARHTRWEEIAAAVLLAGTGAFASLIVRENLTVQTQQQVMAARIAQVALTIAVAFLVMSLLFLFRMRTILSVPLIMLVSMLLLVQVHDGIDTYPVRKLAYGAIGALMLGQATWALNYWPPIGWYAGAILTTLFLGVTMVTDARMSGVLTRERIVLYSAAASGLFLLFTWLSW